MNSLSSIESSKPSGVGNAFLMSARLPNETTALRVAGVERVRMEYEGHFGDREIGELTYEGDEEQILTPGLEACVTQEIQVFFRELLELRFPGWEIAEGSHGAFEWTVEIDTLDHRHEVRVVEYRTVLISND